MNHIFTHAHILQLLLNIAIHHVNSSFCSSVQQTCHTLIVLLLKAHKEIGCGVCVEMVYDN